MKEIMDVKLNARTVDPDMYKADVLAIGLFSDAKGLDRLTKQLDRKLKGAIKRLIGLGDFKGKEGTGAVVYGDGRIGAKRVLLVGLGEKKKATLDTIRKAAACAAKKSVEMKAKTVSLALHSAFGAKFDAAAMGQACAEGAERCGGGPTDEGCETPPRSWCRCGAEDEHGEEVVGALRQRGCVLPLRRVQGDLVEDVGDFRAEEGAAPC